MSGFCQVILVGRLGNAPELKYTQGGTAALAMSIATSRSVKSRVSGEYEDVVSWHRVKAFGRQAEVIAQHCNKGDQLFIEGRLDYWEAEGKRGKLMVSEVVLEHFEFAGRAGGGDRQQDRGGRPPQRNTQQRGRPAQHQDAPPHDDFVDDDIPF